MLNINLSLALITVTFLFLSFNLIQIYDKVKIKDIDRTIDECDIEDMRTITFTYDGTTEIH